MIKCTDGREYLFKQGNGNELESEALVYAEVGSATFILPPIYVDQKLDVIVQPFLRNASTLELIARDSAKFVVGSLEQLAKSLIDSAIQLPITDRQLRFLIPAHVPILDRTTIDRSNAFFQVLNFVQSSPCLSVIFDTADLRMTEAHCDLKLDNVVLDNTSLFLLDWELYSKAPLGWDIASCVGSMLIACSRQSKIAEETAPHLRSVFQVGRSLLDYLNAHLVSRGQKTISVPEFSHLVGRYLFERIASEACFKHYLGPMDMVLLDIARHVTERTLECNE
ncbi:phosphotransferase [bacterium]|nr:phosphotransferase [bacterium]